jgi:hypothetical protein
MINLGRIVVVFVLRFKSHGSVVLVPVERFAEQAKIDFAFTGSYFKLILPARGVFSRGIPQMYMPQPVT